MKKPVVIGLAVVVLAAVVAGGYWWYQSRQDNGLTLYGNVDIRTVNLSSVLGGALNRWRWTKVMLSKRARCWANWITSRMRLPDAGESGRLGGTGAV